MSNAIYEVPVFEAGYTEPDYMAGASPARTTADLDEDPLYDMATQDDGNTGYLQVGDI
jgi:hypothetical protein